MKLVAKINLSDLQRFIDGHASVTEGVQLSLMALNVLINSTPASNFPNKKTSFFPPDVQLEASNHFANSGGGGRGRGGPVSIIFTSSLIHLKLRLASRRQRWWGW